MNTQWATEHFSLELHRYPKGQHDKSLQAWDSADELLVDFVLTSVSPATPLCVFNDNFGAIALGLDGYPLTSLSDSKIAHLAVLENAERNQLSGPEFLNSLAPLPDFDVALIKLSKNLAMLEYQLHQLVSHRPNATILAAGKTTQVTSGVLKLFERFYSDVTTSLAKKKSRLIFASAAKSKFPEVAPLKGFHWPQHDLQLDAYANVFSREQLDIGGRFVAENLPSDLTAKKVIDLGCGNGLLGVATVKETTNAPAHVTFVDESFMAVESARYNVEQNHPEALNHCEFIQNDCLSGFKSNSVDTILCNPPFHQQNAITEHIALQMFKDAKRVLVDGGDLYVVANRHLPYQEPLKKHFGGFKVFAQNAKFIIYHSLKRSNP